MTPDDIRQIRERANAALAEAAEDTGEGPCDCPPCEQARDILGLCEALEAAQEDRRDVGDAWMDSAALSAEYWKRAEAAEAAPGPDDSDPRAHSHVFRASGRGHRSRPRSAVT